MGRFTNSKAGIKKRNNLSHEELPSIKVNKSSENLSVDNQSNLSYLNQRYFGL